MRNVEPRGLKPVPAPKRFGAQASLSAKEGKIDVLNRELKAKDITYHETSGPKGVDEGFAIPMAVERFPIQKVARINSPPVLTSRPLGFTNKNI